MDALGPAELASLLGEACATGRADVINQVLGAGRVPVGQPLASRDGATGLHVASEKGHVDCVRALLKAGAPVDARDSQGRMPLELATPEVAAVFQQELLQLVATGQVDGVRKLLSGGVDPNAGDGTENDSSVLHWAASFGQPKEMVAVLVDAGARLDRQDSSGKTPLHEACQSGHVGSAEALLDMGSDPTVRDKQQQMPLQAIKDEAVRAKLEPRLRAGRAAAADLPPPRQQQQQQQQQQSRQARAGDDEMGELRRLNEEKDLTIVALRETIEKLLEKDGVLKYIAKLQDEYRTLSAQMERVEDHKEHLQSMYLKCDSELERVLNENKALREQLGEKEQRLLELLNEPARPQGDQDQDHNRGNNGVAAATPNGAAGALRTPPSPPKAKDPAPAEGGLRQLERQDIDLALLERNRLAQELESERRLRFSEARLNLGYTSELRKQLKEAQAKLKIAALEQQRAAIASEIETTVSALDKSLPRGGSSKKANESDASRGYLATFFNTLFGGDDDDDDDDEGGNEIDFDEDDDEDDEEAVDL